MKKLNNIEAGYARGGVLRKCYCIAPNGEIFRNGFANTLAECNANCKNYYGNEIKGIFDLYGQNNQDLQVEVLTRL
jgi:hypothetical protein